jgi:hypothetical protein
MVGTQPIPVGELNERFDLRDWMDRAAVFVRGMSGTSLGLMTTVRLAPASASSGGPALPSIAVREGKPEAGAAHEPGGGPVAWIAGGGQQPIQDSVHGRRYGVARAIRCQNTRLAGSRCHMADMDRVLR